MVLSLSFSLSVGERRIDVEHHRHLARLARRQVCSVKQKQLIFWK